MIGHLWKKWNIDIGQKNAATSGEMISLPTNQSEGGKAVDKKRAVSEELTELQDDG